MTGATGFPWASVCVIKSGMEFFVVEVVVVVVSDRGVAQTPGLRISELSLKLVVVVVVVDVVTRVCFLCPLQEIIGSCN